MSGIDYYDSGNVLMTAAQHNRIVEQYRRDAERMRESVSFAHHAIQHLLHNIKESGKRIDLGLAKESALTALEMISAALNQQQAEAKPEPICKFCVGTGKHPHVYDGSVPCQSCQQQAEVKP